MLMIDEATAISGADYAKMEAVLLAAYANGSMARYSVSHKKAQELMRARLCQYIESASNSDERRQRKAALYHMIYGSAVPADFPLDFVALTVDWHKRYDGLALPPHAVRCARLAASTCRAW